MVRLAASKLDAGHPTPPPTAPWPTLCHRCGLYRGERGPALHGYGYIPHTRWSACCRRPRAPDSGRHQRIMRVIIARRMLGRRRAGAIPMRPVCFLAACAYGRGRSDALNTGKSVAAPHRPFASSGRPCARPGARGRDADERTMFGCAFMVCGRQATPCTVKGDACWCACRPIAIASFGRYRTPRTLAGGAGKASGCAGQRLRHPRAVGFWLDEP